MTHREQRDVHKKLVEASGPILLRNWMETRKFLISFLRGSPSSPYFPDNSIFVRDEYQDWKGNLPHIYRMILLAFEKMNDEQKLRVKQLIRASLGDIIRQDEVPQFIEDGLLEGVED